jgi:hypothetical protein
MPHSDPISLRDCIDRIRARYPGDPDIVRLIERAEPRFMRVARRKALICDALQVHFPGKLTCAAKGLDRALGGYRLSNWPAEARHLPVLPDGASPRHCALHAILRASEGKALGWRQITNIAGIAKKVPPLQAACERIVA